MRKITYFAGVLTAFAAAVAVLAAQVALTPPAIVEVQLLAINDFHGALEPGAGANGRIANVDAGGIEYLATHVARLEATNPNTVVVSAGDNIGGTPLLSSLSHDEASVEALNLAGLDVSAVGNHEFDEGWWELVRMMRGGCHPVDGCQDGTPYDGTRFTYLGANVTLDPRKADADALVLGGISSTQPMPLLPAYVVREVGGVRIGFIGLVTERAAESIMATSVRGVIFGPEAEAANEAARQLRQRGVGTIIVLTHEGGTPRASDINGCGLSQNFVEMVNAMSDDIDVVVSGHTHTAYNCTIGDKLVTSAASSGRLVTDIDLRIQRSDGRVVSKTARNVPVTRDVEKHAGASALLAHYRPVAEKVGNRQVGTVSASLVRAANDAGESALGDVIADSMLEVANRTPGTDAVVAFMNSGGIRADIARPGITAPSPVTFAQLFEVLPFGNIVIVKTLTGEAIIQTLEQQFGAERSRMLQVSRGFSYGYDSSMPAGQRIDRASVRINGMPLVPSQRYRVASIDFVWNRGDGLEAMATATDPVIVGVDVEVFADYFATRSPVAAGPRDRIRKVR